MEMFDSAVRSDGDYAGVFEYDGDTAYFYLYEPENDEGKKITDAIHVMTGIPDFLEQDVLVRWDSSENTVGLFIRQKLWAAFDSKTGKKYGGQYRSKAQPEIPLDVMNSFAI